MLYKTRYRFDSSIDYTLGREYKIIIEAKDYQNVIDKLNQTLEQIKSKEAWCKLTLLEVNQLDGWALWK